MYCVNILTELVWFHAMHDQSRQNEEYMIDVLREAKSALSTSLPYILHLFLITRKKTEKLYI